MDEDIFQDNHSADATTGGDDQLAGTIFGYSKYKVIISAIILVLVLVFIFYAKSFFSNDSKKSKGSTKAKAKSKDDSDSESDDDSDFEEEVKELVADIQKS